MKTNIGICTDCTKETEVMSSGIYEGLCNTCKIRKQNAKSRNKEYIPYINLTEKEKQRIDNMRAGQTVKSKKKIDTTTEDVIPMSTVSTIENYYEVKATQNPAIAHIVEKPLQTQKFIAPNINPLADQDSFIKILRGCGCTIPEENLKETLDVLIATDELRTAFLTIAKDENQNTMLDLEHMMNVVERKLQHDWEYNGFQEVDDIKFKGFLTWRRVLKGAIFFWKKLYQTGAIVQMKNAWDTYTADPTEKQLMSGDRITSIQKRYQITTESISTIFNTKKPFTRIFFATSKEEAYDKFVKWMAERQLHEDKSKTVITELTQEGKDGR